MPNLFQRDWFKLNSGIITDFKIDCDALTDDDIKTCAYLLYKRIHWYFRAVEGVPEGGLRLADALRKYTSGTGSILICDDVWTTGGSMNKQRDGRLDVIGAVIFARNSVEAWVTPLFIMQ